MKELVKRIVRVLLDFLEEVDTQEIKGPQRIFNSLYF